MLAVIISCAAHEKFEKNVDLLQNSIALKEGLEMLASAGNELFTDIIKRRNKLLVKISVDITLAAQQIGAYGQYTDTSVLKCIDLYSQ